MARLRGELKDVPHEIKPLCWSGANSIFERDKATRCLAGYLSAEHAEYPQATQLIIAHSHGGNIALRALLHLQMHNAFCSDDGANPFVVTMATSFIEVHPASFGSMSRDIRIDVIFFISIISILLIDFLQYFIFHLSRHEYIVIPLVVILGIITGRWWIVQRAGTRQTKLDTLKNATRLGKLVSGQGLFVIRAIDNEASLCMTFGAIANRLSARFVRDGFYLFGMLGYFILNFSRNKWFFPNWAYAAFVGLFIAWTITMLIVLIISRVVHGRELVRSPMECQVNMHSAPDAIDLSQIVTLVSHNFLKSRRHQIYDMRPALR